MREVIVSIHPEYARAILAGTKRYEYRRRIWKRDADEMVIYATRPIRKVVGRARIVRILALPPERLWDLTHEHAGLGREQFLDYFGNAETAYAAVLDRPEAFTPALGLAPTTGLVRPPQSFAYPKSVST